MTATDLFKMHCVVCHGIDGKMQMNGAKDLSLSTMSTEERIIRIKNGKGLMTPFKGILSDEEINKLAEFTHTFNHAQKK